MSGTGVTSQISASGKIAWAGYNASGDFVQSAAHMIPMLLGAGIRVQIFTGQYDECMNVQSTANWLSHLDGCTVLGFGQIRLLVLEDAIESNQQHSSRVIHALA